MKTLLEKMIFYSGLIILLGAIILVWFFKDEKVSVLANFLKNLLITIVFGAIIVGAIWNRRKTKIENDQKT